MKSATGAAAAALILCGCGGTVQWARAPEVSDAACTASCNAHYEQCPQVFAEFPERGAVECPAERSNCLKACVNARPSGHIAAAPATVATPSSARAEASKEAKLRELKHFHDEGLVTEDVYRERQKAILAEP